MPFALVAFWSANRTRVERETEVREQAGSIATTAGAYLDQYLTGLDSMALVLVRQPSVIALDRVECDKLFTEIRRAQPLLMNVLVTDPGGELRGSGIPTSQVAVSPTTMPYVKAVATSGKPMVTELMNGRISGKPTVILAYPVRDAHETVVGVLALSINLTSLQTLFSDIPLPEGSAVTLTDAKGASSREATTPSGSSGSWRTRTPDCPGTCRARRSWWVSTASNGSTATRPSSAVPGC